MAEPNPNPNRETPSEKAARTAKERQDAIAAGKATKDVEEGEVKERVQDAKAAGERAKKPVAPTKVNDLDVTEEEYRNLSPIRKAQVDEYRKGQGDAEAAATPSATPKPTKPTPRPTPRPTPAPRPERSDYLSPRDYNAAMEKYKAEQEADPEYIAQNRALRKMSKE